MLKPAHDLAAVGAYFLLINFKIGSEPSMLGPDPSQTFNSMLQFRSVQCLASGVRQVSRSSLLVDELVDLMMSLWGNLMIK